MLSTSRRRERISETSEAWSVGVKRLGSRIDIFSSCVTSLSALSGKYESPLEGTGGGEEDMAGELKPLRDERRDIPSEGVQYGVSVGEGEA